MASPKKTEGSGLDAKLPNAAPTEAQDDLVRRVGAVLKRARASDVDTRDLEAALERRIEALERRVTGWR